MKIGSSMSVSNYQYTNRINKTQKDKDKSQEKLSSGKKVNSAADDAAALAISEKMMKQIRALDQGSNNIQNGIQLSNIADGAMSSVSENLLDLQTNSIRAMNGTMSAGDKEILNEQAQETMKTVDHIANSTDYNGKKLTNGSTKDISIHTGTSTESISTSNVSIDALGLQNFNLTDDNIDTKNLDNAAKSVASQRSTIGAQTNGLESTYRSNQIASENTTAAYSRQVDTEMEEEVITHKKHSVLQAAQTKMAKAKMNQDADMVTRMF